MKKLLQISIALIFSAAVNANEYPEQIEFKEWIIENFDQLKSLDIKLQQDDRFDYIWNIVPPRFRSRSQNGKSVDIQDKEDYIKLLPKNANVLISSDNKKFVIENGVSSVCGKKMCIVSAVMFRSDFDGSTCQEAAEPAPGVCFIRMFENWYLRYLIFDVDA
ncbi:hypothetical protein L1F30_15635 [Simiduia sp. 21SJ11W-1]|uniref:hypothetical protein n=1 Tax=Simiduia sp. 21SJ11W-1 TaxID=2909669 RepID=UPI00209F1527|nr:hypothetical protein [Simiduia sp. 21SJ11W-1]UTA47573.1 hypothetical protein L1F30_15635 [Simiduia sp. 21SJ11W-1]